MRIREYALGNGEFTDGKPKPLLPGGVFSKSEMSLSVKRSGRLFWF